MLQGCGKNQYSKINCIPPSIWRFPDGLDGKKSALSAGDGSLNPGLRRSPGEGNGNPLQYS